MSGISSLTKENFISGLNFWEHIKEKSKYKYYFCLAKCHYCKKDNILLLNKKSKYDGGCFNCGKKWYHKPTFVVSAEGNIEIFHINKKGKKGYKKYKKLFVMLKENTIQRAIRKIGYNAENFILKQLNFVYPMAGTVQNKITYISTHIKNKDVADLLNTYPKAIDLFTFDGKNFVFYEVKTRSSKLSRHQRIVLDKLIDNGFKCFLYYSESGVDDWKIIFLNELNFKDRHIQKNIEKLAKSCGKNKLISEQKINNNLKSQKIILYNKIMNWQKRLNYSKGYKKAMEILDLLYAEWNLKYNFEPLPKKLSEIKD